MHVLITYDVRTVEKEGERRLRRVARLCEDYGQRVQSSVFECKLDPAQFASMKAQLLEIIDSTQDSLRFYLLGKEWHRRVETLGVNRSFDPDDPLIA